MLPVRSEINPKSGGNIAPPTIDITINDEPILVLWANPSIPMGKMVGNMMLIKKAVAMKV